MYCSWPKPKFNGLLNVNRQSRLFDRFLMTNWVWGNKMKYSCCHKCIGYSISPSKFSIFFRHSNVTECSQWLQMTFWCSHWGRCEPKTKSKMISNIIIERRFNRHKCLRLKKRKGKTSIYCNGNAFVRQNENVFRNNGVVSVINFCSGTKEKMNSRSKKEKVNANNLSDDLPQYVLHNLKVFGRNFFFNMSRKSNKILWDFFLLYIRRWFKRNFVPQF